MLRLETHVNRRCAMYRGQDIRIIVIKSRLSFPVGFLASRTRSACFSVMMFRADLSKIFEMSRNSFSPRNGSQSTSLFRQYGDRLRTTIGTNGRRKSTLRAMGLSSANNRPSTLNIDARKIDVGRRGVPDVANRICVFVGTPWTHSVEGYA